MASIPACFSESYAEARAKFCNAAAIAGGALRSWLNPHVKGPSGEPLYLDTARFGPADAPTMLVLISSTHGVERDEQGRDPARVRRLRPEVRRLRAPRRDQQRPVHPSGRHLLRRPQADLE